MSNNDAIAGLPRWVWAVVAALDEYEDTHPKFPDAWGCVSHIHDLVPEETRRLADVLIEVGALTKFTA